MLGGKFTPPTARECACPTGKPGSRAGWTAVGYTGAMSPTRARVAALQIAALGTVACGSEQTGPEPDPPIPFEYARDDTLRMDQLQLVATHNSYRIMPEGMTITALQYDHPPLDVQLREQGARGFELDIRYDAELDTFVVYHLPVIDELTHCPRLVDCLRALEKWSRKRPGHHPLFVQIEPKDGLPADAEPLVSKLEQEILSVWPRSRIVTPDDVRGDSPTLAAALASDGWPTLGETRGKIVFFVDDTSSFRDGYTRGGKDLDGRLMFVDSDPGDPFGGFAVINDPIGGATSIAAALAANFIVRTRADGDNIEPLAGDTTRRDAALSSGAQVVSTDYPVAKPGVNFVVELPGGAPSRCNPVTAPAECAATDIENPAFVE